MEFASKYHVPINIQDKKFREQIKRNVFTPTIIFFQAILPEPESRSNYCDVPFALSRNCGSCKSILSTARAMNSTPVQVRWNFNRFLTHYNLIETLVSAIRNWIADYPNLIRSINEQFKSNPVSKPKIRGRRVIRFVQTQFIAKRHIKDRKSCKCSFLEEILAIENSEHTVLKSIVEFAGVKIQSDVNLQMFFQ